MSCINKRDNLTPTNSLVHLLDSNDTDDDKEVLIVKHSTYYDENDFLQC